MSIAISTACCTRQRRALPDRAECAVLERARARRTGRPSLTLALPDDHAIDLLARSHGSLVAGASRPQALAN